jgi:hypothetical protein
VATTGDEPTGFAITAGDPDAAFAIDANGQITVADESKLDFETTPSYSLTVEATDGTTPVTETVTVTVTDSGTVITAGQSFNVSETAANGTVVGSVVTTGDEPTGFSITAGDPDSAFAIDANGQITVADESKLDFETKASYSLTIEATDGTTPVTETVTVTVTDSGTVITAGQSFNVSETAANGTVVGSVATTGDEATGFSITAGDPDSAFSIDASGQITVADESRLDFETTASYSLTIEATDGTTPVTETVTVSVTDSGTVITAGQGFNVSETQ